jgi:hypothetical protein
MDMRRLAPITLLLLFALAPALRAQAAAPAAPQSLVINILSGEGALNDVRQRTAREPIVQVEDENHKPVAGATVLFLLPDSGPGGTFADGTRAFHTVTDADGRARAQMKPNSTAGNWDIIVQASFAGATASATIRQQNFSSAGSGSSTAVHATHILSAKSLIIILGSMAAAGTVAGVLATRGGNSTSITPGTPTVGAPAASGGIRIPLNRHAH